MVKGSDMLFYINIDIKSDYQQKVMSSMSDLSKLDTCCMKHKGEVIGAEGEVGQNLKRGGGIDNIGSLCKIRGLRTRCLMVGSHIFELFQSLRYGFFLFGVTGSSRKDMIWFVRVSN